MYARVTTIDGNPGRIDEVIAFVKETVEPLVRQLQGSCGLAMFINRDKGQIVVTTAWESEAARAASDAPLIPIRGEAGRILGGQAHLEEFDLAVRELLQPAAPGYWNRTSRLAVPAGRLDDAINSFRDKVLPGLRQQEGFCSGVLLVDRHAGTALALTTWASRAALEHSRPAADQLRAGTADSAGARIVEVVEREIVIAGITAPRQHEDALRRAYAAMSADGDLNDLDAVMHADLLDHAAGPPGLPSGLAGLKAVMEMYHQGFPDFTIAIERYLEQGDTGCAVVRMVGTNTGSFMGAPPSGRPIDISGVDVVRFVDGKAAEHWGAEDTAGLFAQLGLSSIPAQPMVSIELPSEVRA